ncbi:MAG TPA: DUF4190 domain-containing protein [Pyrinomonadaceae bacterium]
MKRCPTCQRNFPDDAPDYCSFDGMRLVREEAAAFDPEMTMTASDARPAESSPQTPPPQMPVPPQPHAAHAAAPAPSSPALNEQAQQQWQPQPAVQGAQQAWSSSAAPAAQQQPQAWGGQFQQSPSNVPLDAQFAQAQPLRRRALATASIVFGVAAGTVMAITIAGSDANFRYVLMLILSILSIVLGIGALFLAIKRSARFGGVELAIAGLALGVAGLVYALLNQNWDPK